MTQATAGGKPALAITRAFNIPREELYRAWTDPDLIKRWFAPSDAYAVPEAALEARPGGRYRIVMRAPDGEVHRVGGVYRVCLPPARLVFTWAWESTPERESLVTAEFGARGAATELVLRHEHFADEAARDRHQQGWNGCLDRLARLQS